MARIVGAFGIKGWVKVKAFTAAPGALGAHRRWLVGTPGDWRETVVEGFAVHSRGPVAKLAGCDDRAGADRLRGLEVAVRREALGDAGEGWMYRIDLVGLDVVDRTGASLGQVEGFVDAGEADPRVVLLSPQGERLTQAVVAELGRAEGLVLVAGRYEGVDERLVARSVDREISIGDYVTSGGELPAMVLIDCLVRQMPGSLNDAESAVEESFAAGMLDWPHFTRPEVWREARVPEVLLSGNHASIRRWRRKQALGRTWERRPEL